MKKLQQILGAFLIALIAISLTPPVEVEASIPVCNNHICTNVNASRPLIGNPRGTAFVTTRSANNQAVCASVHVLNSNGTRSTHSPWVQNSSSSLQRALAAGVCWRSTEQRTGSTRSGTVVGEGQRRPTTTSQRPANWSTSLQAHRGF